MNVLKLQKILDLKSRDGAAEECNQTNCVLVSFGITISGMAESTDDARLEVLVPRFLCSLRDLRRSSFLRLLRRRLPFWWSSYHGSSQFSPPNVSSAPSVVSNTRFHHSRFDFGHSLSSGKPIPHRPNMLLVILLGRFSLSSWGGGGSPST